MTSLLAVKRLANALKESLGQYGPVLQLNSTSIGLLFPTAFERLDVLFYRSKVRYSCYTAKNCGIANSRCGARFPRHVFFSPPITAFPHTPLCFFLCCSPQITSWLSSQEEEYK